MALQWADDFNRYSLGSSGITEMLDGLPYAILDPGGNVSTDPDPNAGGTKVLQISPTRTRVALPNIVTEILGVANQYWFATLPADINNRPRFISFMEGDANSIIHAFVEPNGSVTVVAEVGGIETVVADSINPIIQPASWNRIEFVHDFVLGEGTLYLNGVSRLTWTGTDTGRTCELVQFARSGVNAFMKGLAIWDSVGSGVTSPIGNATVVRLKPVSDVTLGDWVPSTGTTGFNLLAKDGANDSTYLSVDDTIPSEAMAYNFENLPPDATSVLGLLFVTRQRKTDGGDANLQSALSPNGVDWDNGADRAITTAFQYEFDVSELSPATGTAWTPVEVDALIGRIDRTL